MKCEYCNNEIQPGVTVCPACGAPAPAANTAPTPAAAPVAAQPAAMPVYAQQQPPVVVVNAAPQVAQPVYPYPPKSRISYILLAFFFGGLGIHNFYAKRTGCGVTQLLLTVLSLGWLAIISGFWALIEIFVVDKDGNGVPFK